MGLLLTGSKQVRVQHIMRPGPGRRPGRDPDRVRDPDRDRDPDRAGTAYIMIPSTAEEDLKNILVSREQLRRIQQNMLASREQLRRI